MSSDNRQRRCWKGGPDRRDGPNGEIDEYRSSSRRTYGQLSSSELKKYWIYFFKHRHIEILLQMIDLEIPVIAVINKLVSHADGRARGLSSLNLLTRFSDIP